MQIRDRNLQFDPKKRIVSVTVACVKLPDRHPVLNVIKAFSPNNGRCICMISSSGSGSGIAVVRPDESSIVQKQQQQQNAAAAVRERYDFVPIIGSVRFATWIFDDSPSSQIRALIPSDGMYDIATDDLGMVHNGRLFVLSNDAREIIITIPKSVELVVDVLRSIVPSTMGPIMHHGIRDLSIQFGSDQFAALLFSIMVNLSRMGASDQMRDDQISLSLIERLLFQAETAAGLGFVDFVRWPAAGAAAAGGNPLGSILQSANLQVSNRTRGFALFFSRLIRPFWLTKCFKLELYGDGILAIHPTISSAQRQWILMTIKPVVELLTNYRHQLAATMMGGSGESKTIEGFLVLASAIVECMELLRLIESGQLVSSTLAQVTDMELLNSLDQVLVRDIVLGAGVGNDALMEFVSNREGIDGALLRKHCPIIVPKCI